MSPQAKRKYRIIAVIPAYNEEYTIAKVILQTKKYVDVVMVGDDGSSDMTGEIARALGAIVIDNGRNRGKGHTLKRLLNEALSRGADIVVALDADGQHDPSYIPKLIEPIILGQADIVIGSRYLDVPPDRIPLYRKIGLKVIDLFHKPVIKGVKDTQSGYRAYSRKVVEVLAKELRIQGYGTETEQLFIVRKNNWKVIEIPIRINYKTKNPSKKNPFTQGLEIIQSLIKLTVEERPLLILGTSGFLFTLFGLSVAAYTIWVFNKMRYFFIPIALAAIASTLTGILLIVASLILHAISNLRNTQE